MKKVKEKDKEIEKCEHAMKPVELLRKLRKQRLGRPKGRRKGQVNTGQAWSCICQCHYDSNLWKNTIPSQSCAHCYCKKTMVNAIPHKQCCNCGNSQQDNSAGLASYYTTGGATTPTGSLQAEMERLNKLNNDTA